MSEKTLEKRKAGLPARVELNMHAPAVDVAESDTGVVLHADLPGVRKDDLALRVEEDVLTVEGEARGLPQGTALHTERSPRRYFRQFRLGEQIDREKIQAEFNDGVLSVLLPKLERARPRKIPVQVA